MRNCLNYFRGRWNNRCSVDSVLIFPKNFQFVVLDQQNTDAGVFFRRCNARCWHEFWSVFFLRILNIDVRSQHAFFASFGPLSCFEWLVLGEEFSWRRETASERTAIVRSQQWICILLRQTISEHRKYVCVIESAAAHADVALSFNLNISCLVLLRIGARASSTAEATWIHSDSSSLSVNIVERLGSAQERDERVNGQNGLNV